MPQTTCKKCNKRFSAKPYFLKKGYALYCSRPCYYASVQHGRQVACDTCGAFVYRGLKQIRHSKSEKYFCSKSCQAIWRNHHYVGNKHRLWKGGRSVHYRKILMNSHTKPICLLCDTKDKRIIVVHHIDEDRSNNSLANLAWLCRNCHHLVHYDTLEKQRLTKLLRINMASMV